MFPAKYKVNVMFAVAYNGEDFPAAGKSRPKHGSCVPTRAVNQSLRSANEVNMESRVKFMGHALHPMLIVFPLGLLATSVIFDIIASLRTLPDLFIASYWMIAAGVLGGLLSAVFGLIDWMAIPQGTRAKNIGMWHGLSNAVVIVLFAASWLLRDGVAASPPLTARALSLIAFVFAGLAAWLGGELVDRLGVGVDDGAHLNSSNSLSGRPARESDSKVRRTA